MLSKSQGVFYLSKPTGIYKSGRRQKEVARQKKQEEKRNRRFHKEERPSLVAEKPANTEEKEPANP
jgi:hypothetical protein